MKQFKFQSRDPSGFWIPEKLQSYFFSEGWTRRLNTLPCSRELLSNGCSGTIITTRNGFCQFLTTISILCHFFVVVVTETTVVLIPQFQCVRNNKRLLVVHVQIENLEWACQSKLNFTDLSDCSINVTNSSKPSIFPVRCSNKNSNAKLHFDHSGRFSHAPRTARSMSALSPGVFIKMVQCHRTEFTKCLKSFLSTSYRLILEYKWHHTTLL